VSAGGAFDFALLLDPLGIPDMQVLVKANAQGVAADMVTIYTAVAL
jgi:hypothetical protein